MTTRTRAATVAAGLALFGLAGPLLAGPLGNAGYAPSNGYASNGPAFNGATNATYSAPAAPSSGGGCATCAASTPSASSGHPGHKVDCPPPYYHVYEGPPCMKFKKGCPRPVCDPCELPHFGYFQTCWSPWPYPRDFRHCPYPHPSDALPPPAYPPFTPKLNAPRDVGPERVRRGGEAEDGRRRLPEPDEGPDVGPAPGRQEGPEKLGPPNKLDDKEKGKKEQGGETSGLTSDGGTPTVRLVRPR
jgi:hypothetical protein